MFKNILDVFWSIVRIYLYSISLFSSQVLRKRQLYPVYFSALSLRQFLYISNHKLYLFSSVSQSYSFTILFLCSHMQFLCQILSYVISPAGKVDLPVSLNIQIISESYLSYLHSSKHFESLSELASCHPKIISIRAISQRINAKLNRMWQFVAFFHKLSPK